MVAPFAMYPKGTVNGRMLSIASQLASRGHDVSIVIPPYDNLSHSGKNFEINGVKIYNIAINSTAIGYFLNSARLLKKTLNLKPDVVHIFKPKGYSGLAGMLLIAMRCIGLFGHISIVLDMDDWEGYGGFNDYYLARSIYPKTMLNFFDFQERWIPMHSDVITVASKTLEARLLKWGITPEKIFYVPNGPLSPARGNPLSLSRNSEDNNATLRKILGLDDNPVILWYTRFMDCNVRKVIDILKHVSMELKNAKVLVIGRGDFNEENDLEKLAIKEGIGDSIVFAGWVSPKELHKYISVGDVAIYPFDDTLLNRSKCPGKLVELMALGKAIVADRVGQMAEYIEHGESGLLADPEDVQQFAKNVAKVLGDECLIRKLGYNAKMRIHRSFGWKKLSAKVEEAYRLSITANIC